MPVASYTMPVEAPAAVVWQLLRDSAEFPQRFAHGVEAVRISERDGDSWVRELAWDGALQRERISVDDASRTVTASLLQHATHTGEVRWRVELPGASAAQRTPRLSFRMDWRAQQEPEDQTQATALSGALEHELLAIKRAAEERAAMTAG
jgi:hypothetical protein